MGHGRIRLREPLANIHGPQSSERPSELPPASTHLASAMHLRRRSVSFVAVAKIEGTPA